MMERVAMLDMFEFMNILEVPGLNWVVILMEKPQVTDLVILYP